MVIVILSSSGCEIIQRFWALGAQDILQAIQSDPSSSADVKSKAGDAIDALKVTPLTPVLYGPNYGTWF